MLARSSCRAFASCSTPPWRWTIAARKAAFAKLQRFVVEQALQAPQYVMFGVTVRSKQVRNYVDGLLTTPKFHQVWLETGSG